MKIPQTAPQLDELLDDPELGIESFRRLTGASIEPVDEKGRYLHWDEIRNRAPPAGLTPREWWTAIKAARLSNSRLLPLRSVTGEPFRFTNVDVIQEAVHKIDQKASGRIQIDDRISNLPASDRYLVSSLIEEAITSSQLEGASTTRKVAKEMLLSGRKPRDNSERMILNNYRAMLNAQRMAEDPLTPESVLGLQRTLTEDTDLKPSAVGRLQTPEEERVGVYWHDNTELHVPPPAVELSERQIAMCRFANGETPDGFLHPIVRAIVLHFWLAYDHPFEDGNGRTARALFYWAMLRSDYWLTQYISISSILRKAPAQYARTYLYSETDGNDLTYFIIYQLSVIERAIASLFEYLQRKMEETREVEELVHGSAHLNHRQLDVVREAMRDPVRRFTIAAQQSQHRVTYQTARVDLLQLEEMGLLERTASGRKYIFRAKPDLVDRLRQLAATS